MGIVQEEDHVWFCVLSVGVVDSFG
jgi:hypothetical protein